VHDIQLYPDFAGSDIPTHNLKDASDIYDCDCTVI